MSEDGIIGGIERSPEQAVHDVLDMLERDARLAPERIAQAIGRSADEVRDIIAQAEEDRIILHYGALIDWSRAGESEVEPLRYA
ncbi:MAG TPA: Lrp/AsnC family transcriptional regulator [Dehalococcoidia bacterium]|nr:Lrp/AsnC family transcriptional regulator [Dehalococcoidia bacterium]